MLVRIDMLLDFLNCLLTAFVLTSDGSIVFFLH